MKILVTGKNGKFVSYFRDYTKKKWAKNEYDYISLKNDDWEEYDFSKYDSVFHFAGVVSAPNDDETTFQKVNVELTEKVFKKAVDSGVKYFLYLSSMAVYDGIGWGFDDKGFVTNSTEPKQATNYGRSKFEAEQIIYEIVGREEIAPKVAIVRAPSIVGDNLEAYFGRYIKYSRIPIVPIPWTHTEAKRSFIYVDSLIDYILKIAEENRDGIFFPQQLPPLSVSEMMMEVSKAVGKRKKASVLFGKLLPRSIIERFFSQICYDSNLCNDDMSKIDSISSYEAIRRTILAEIAKQIKEK